MIVRRIMYIQVFKNYRIKGCTFELKTIGAATLTGPRQMAFPMENSPAVHHTWVLEYRVYIVTQRLRAISLPRVEKKKVTKAAN